MRSAWDLPAIQWSIGVLLALMSGWLINIGRRSIGYDRVTLGRSNVAVPKGEQAQARLAERDVLKEKADSLDLKHEDFVNDPEFLVYNKVNADCDRTLFDLFLDKIAPRELPHEAT